MSDFNARRALTPYVNKESNSPTKEEFSVPTTNMDVNSNGGTTDEGEAGSSEFIANEWMTKATQIKREGETENPIGDDAQDYYFDRNEVGIKHPLNGSVIKCTDDGFIDIFAGDQLGIRIDPASKSINLLGDTVNLFTKKFNVKTTPNGFIWNDYYFNPQLYYEDERERAQIITGHKEYYHYTHGENPSLQWHRDPWEVQPMKRSQANFRYSQGVKDIMKNLGLTTPDE